MSITVEEGHAKCFNMDYQVTTASGVAYMTCTRVLKVAGAFHEPSN
jgi:hypothetical protein